MPGPPFSIAWSRLLDELAELALGGGEAALVHMDGGERQPRLDMGRRPADGVAEAPRRLVEVAQPSRHQAEIVGEHRLVGVLGDRLAPHALGVAERAALRQAHGKEVQDVGPLAVACQGRTEQRLGTIEPARLRYCRPVCRSGSGGGGVREGGDVGARAMARCVDPPRRQGYTKCHGQGCRPVRCCHVRGEAAQRSQADRPREDCHPEAEGRGTFEAARKGPSLRSG